MTRTSQSGKALADGDANSYLLTMLILADSGSVRQVVYTSPDGAFSWIDIAAPDRPTIGRLAVELDLDEEALEDCLDTHQLPKTERIGDYAFLILRLHSGSATSTAAGVYEMTQPLALFISARRLVTLHRRDHPVLFRLRKHVGGVGPELEQPELRVAEEILAAALMTFDTPLSELSTELVELESTLSDRRLTENALEQVFVRKRRASVMSWVLLRTREMLARARLPRDVDPAVLEGAREAAETLHIRSREVVDFTDNLLNLQIAIASHRTNEVMRLLTVMSAVFMPLTFIVGLYGMNFDAPEFKWRHGYLMVWILIGAVLFGILRWFRRKGLLD